MEVPTTATPAVLVHPSADRARGDRDRPDDDPPPAAAEVPRPPDHGKEPA